MPYSKVPDHPDCDAGEIAVVKDSTGEVMGCHETEASADDQIAALHASESETNMADSNIIFATSALVRRDISLDTRALIDTAIDNHALDPAIFEERDPYFWPAEISSIRLDSYYTWMKPSTLRNFVEDAQAGVSFQDSHKTRQLGFGRSLDARLDEMDDVEAQRTHSPVPIAETMMPDDIDPLRVLASFYTLRGLNLNGTNTDDYINGMRAGIVRDVSVGFYGARFVCDICGLDLFDWDCSHFPGLRYEVSVGDEETIEAVATAGVEGARLAEVSAVYDGATPGAGILKAERASEAGEVDPEQARVLERHYRIKLPASRHRYAGWEKNEETDGDRPERKPATKDREVPMSDEQTDTIFRDAFRFIRGQLAEHGHVDNEAGVDTVKRAVRSLVVDEAAAGETLARFGSIDDVDMTEVTVSRGVDVLAGEVRRLRPLAEDGEQYRADLIDEAIREGVRANGDEFNQDLFRSQFENADLDFIKEMREMWTKQGDEQFADTGRLSKDGEEGGDTEPPDTKKEEEARKPRMPADAHRA